MANAISKNFDHDIIVIGAGPGGLNAAYHAATAGADVLVLDKKHELGLPVRCGEAVVETVLSDNDIEPKPEFVSNKVNSLFGVSSKGKEISLTLKIYGYILNRDKFEKHLGDRAVKHGAKIQLDTTAIGLNKNKLIITKDGGKTRKTITGKIIIAADGVESRVGRWAGLETTLHPVDLSVGCQYVVEDLELEKNTIEFYWGRKFSPHGYIWVFPKSDKTANVGIITLGNQDVNVQGLLDKFIKTRAPGSKKLSFTTGCVPDAIPPKRLVKDNVLLVGDAARIAVPVTGSGIGHAMTSGRWAGELAGAVCVNNLNIQELKKYEKSMAVLKKKVKRAYGFKQKLIRDEEFLELIFGALIMSKIIIKLNPKFVEKFIMSKLSY